MLVPPLFPPSSMLQPLPNSDSTPNATREVSQQWKSEQKEGPDMEPLKRCSSSVQRPVHLANAVHAGVFLALFIGVWYAQALEVSVGKVHSMEAVNGSTVLLPCTYSSCIGILKLYFNWQYNNNGSMVKICEGIVPAEGAEPQVKVYWDRVEFVGSSKTSNISILLWNITFEDEGQYTCFARNPKEMNRNHSAIFTLTVVDELKEVDNTLTIIIASIVGGIIGLIIVIMVLKALILFIIRKVQEKNKECLVSSSGIDNTENGLSGSKADNKTTPKA